MRVLVLHDFESSRKWILNVLHHPEAAPFIEMEIQRLTNRRFARDDLHLQTVTDVEEAQRFFGRGSLTTARTFDSFPARFESFDEPLYFRGEVLFLFRLGWTAGRARPRGLFLLGMGPESGLLQTSSGGDRYEDESGKSLQRSREICVSAQQLGPDSGAASR